MSSYFNLIFIYEQWLVITASREDLAAVVFVSNKFVFLSNLSCHLKEKFSYFSRIVRR